MGYGKHAVDDSTLALIGEAFEELDRLAARRIVYRIFDLTVKEPDCIEIGKLCIRSRSLGRNMKGCEKAVLLGATLGIGIDMYMRKLSITNMAKAVVIQSCAAALLEEYLDGCQLAIGQEAGGVMHYNEVPNVLTPFAGNNAAGTLKPLDALRWIKTQENLAIASPSAEITDVPCNS